MRTRATSLLVLALLVVACSGEDEPARRARNGTSQARGPITKFEVELRELEGSGVTGTAKLETVGAEAGSILVELDEAPDGELALHTHSGPCIAQATAPTHDMEPVVDGRGETQISAAVQGLTHGGFNLSVHADEDGDSEHISCGEIGGGPVDE